MSKNKDAWGAVEGFVNSATIPLNLPQSLYFLKFKDIGKSILASFVEKEYKNYKEYKEFGELER
ncbi:MAG: hypothetical protein SPI08_04335, partial [Campylobacter sp.]|nr:hypothetical protein [Campylobacter sp.]